VLTILKVEDIKSKKHSEQTRVNLYPTSPESHPLPLLRQLNRITPYSKHSLDKGSKKVQRTFLPRSIKVKVVLGLRFKVKRLGSRFGEGVRKLVFPSPTYILPLPKGGGGVRRGWVF